MKGKIYMKDITITNKPTMLTIKQAAALVDGLTEFRVRELCKSGELPCFRAGKKYLINKEILHKFLLGELSVG
jgi:excisionase family DNA binding protein